MRLVMVSPHLPGGSNWRVSWLDVSLRVIAIISELRYLLLGSKELKMISANY